MQGDPLRADLPRQVHPRARAIAQRSAQLVSDELRLHRLPHRALRAEEAIRRHQPVDPLVRAEEVVVADVVRQPAPRVLEVLRLRPVPEFVADGLPQPLALPERLGVMRAAHHVLDAFLREQLLEAALAAPGVVLAALVGQHFDRLPVARDAVQEGLGDERGPLMARELPRHDVAAVVVQEDRQVHAPAFAPQDEARDVRLPELAGLGALEAARELGFCPPAPRRRRLRGHAALPQDLPHPARAHAQAVEAFELVGDPLRAEVRVLARDALDGVAGVLRETFGMRALWAALARAGLEALRALVAVPLQPLVEGRRRAAPQAREVRARAVRRQVRLDARAALLRREAARVGRRRLLAAAALREPVLKGGREEVVGFGELVRREHRAGEGVEQGGALRAGVATAARRSRGGFVLRRVR